jgi:flavin-binding protein dodecin
LKATRRKAAKPAAGVVVRVEEATGTAKGGFDQALAAAVKAARAEVDAPIGVEITRQWADLSARGIASYHVNVKVAYRQPLAAPKREAKKKTA